MEKQPDSAVRINLFRILVLIIPFVILFNSCTKEKDNWTVEGTLKVEDNLVSGIFSSPDSVMVYLITLDARIDSTVGWYSPQDLIDSCMSDQDGTIFNDGIPDPKPSGTWFWKDEDIFPYDYDRTIIFKFGNLPFQEKDQATGIGFVHQKTLILTGDDLRDFNRFEVTWDGFDFVSVKRIE